MRFPKFSLLFLVLAGCASTPSGPEKPPTAPPAERTTRESTEARPDTQAAVDTPARPPVAVRRPQGPRGVVSVDISDVSGRQLPARVVFRDLAGDLAEPFEIASGRETVEPVAGTYQAYVYVYEKKVPVLSAVEKVEVRAGESVPLQVTLLEGASGKLGLRDFDQDQDLALDRVELELGTDPGNARSIPGKKTLDWDARVLGGVDSPRWFRGDLQAVSTYGGGKEGVAALIQRAEQAGLDFLAITDLNTMDACNDPAFHSDRVVLIPALAWGSKENGVALIYGPGTMPDPPESEAMTQAECSRVQNQGGIFAIAHPCFGEAPWKWDIGYFNAVQVWNGPWREHAPLRLADLPVTLKLRAKGDLIYSVAAAAAVADKTAEVARNAKRKDVGVSANDQAATFWDYELVRGSVSSVIAGGGNPAMGQPVTWVYAANKSLPALMQGLRMGRTFVANRPDGVQLNFRADVLNDGKVDVGMGGAVPLGVDVGFYILVTGAAGAKAQLLRNGHPIMTESIDSNTYSVNFLQTTDFQAAYRVRVIRQPDNPNKGYGPVEVLAMSSPIYADDIGRELLWTGPVDQSKTWVELKEDKYTGPPIDPKYLAR